MSDALATATRYRRWRNDSLPWMDEGSREVELANYPVGEGGGGNTDSRGVSGARSRQLNTAKHPRAPHASSCGTISKRLVCFSVHRGSSSFGLACSSSPHIAKRSLMFTLEEREGQARGLLYHSNGTGFGESITPPSQG